MVRGFRGDEYSERDLQDYDAVHLSTPISAFRWNLPPPTSLETEAVSFAQNHRNYHPDYVVSDLNVKCETQLESLPIEPRILQFLQENY